MARDEFDGLDRLIEDSLDALPPEDVADRVSAGKSAFDLIIAGLALSTITLNFLALNYILPMLGVVLLMLGTRRLRGENGWFTVCFAISVLRCVLAAAQCLIASTVYSDAFTGSGAADIAAGVSVALVLALIFCLRGGILKTQRSAGLEPHAGGATALIVWYAAVGALALVHAEGLILVAGLIICFILILRSLARLANELIDASYAVTPSPVRVSDKALCITIFALLAAGIVCGHSFFARYPMQWQAEPEPQSTELRQALLDAGYPEQALRDLSDEDLALCKGFTAVCVDDDEPHDNGSGVELMTVAVKLDEHGTRWRIFHHFEWIDAQPVGTELLRVIPCYADSPAWYPDGELTGRVLCGADGETLSAPYYSLSGSGDSVSTVLGMFEPLGILGSFSMPAGSEQQRGYISYGTGSSAAEPDELFLSTAAGYVHQRSTLQFPVRTAEGAARSGAYGGCFAIVWNTFSVAN